MRAGWRTALRIARRDALRHRGRSLLVLVMLGLPVLGAVGLDVIYRTSKVTPARQATYRIRARDVAGNEQRYRWNAVTVDPAGGTS